MASHHVPSESSKKRKVEAAPKRSIDLAKLYMRTGETFKPVGRISGFFEHIEALKLLESIG